MKTSIITGIAGQDGAYLARLLLGHGYRVIGLTRSLSGLQDFRLKYLGILDQVELIEMPELSKDLLIPLLDKIEPDEVYNLAAQSSVGLSFAIPHETIQFNILSVLSWLEAISVVDKKIKFYQASSSEMFGNIKQDQLPLRENLLFHPASPYGISKAAAHWLIINYREAKQVFAANGILFNHESALRGPNYVVKKIINHLTKIQLGLTEDLLYVGNTSIRRDWGYAPYYIEAMYRILQHDQPDDFLICSGNVMSLDDLIEMVCRQLHLSKEKYIRVDPQLFRLNELYEIYGDPSKARSVLHWDYNLTNQQLVDQLIRDEMAFIDWQQQNSTRIG